MTRERQPLIADVDRRLVDLVEQLAEEYRDEVGLRPVIAAVCEAYGAQAVYPDESDVPAEVERAARAQLDLYTGRPRSPCRG